MKNPQPIIVELASCEEKLDAVLFSAGDTAAGAAAAGGLGAAYIYGKRANKTKPKFDLGDIGANIGEGIQTGASDLWANLLKMGKRTAKAASKAV